jgi:hypothetical protein
MKATKFVEIAVLEDGRIIINSSEEDLSIFLEDLGLDYEIEYEGMCG